MDIVDIRVPCEADLWIGSSHMNYFNAKNAINSGNPNDTYEGVRYIVKKREPKACPNCALEHTRGFDTGYRTAKKDAVNAIKDTL